jgi:CRP-like cAMP-binding protein/Zn-dependent protease
MKYNSMALGRIQHLVELLQDKGLVTGGVVDKVYGSLQNKLAAAGVVGKLRQGFGWLMTTFLFRQFPVDGIGGVVNAAYKWGVWLLYTRVALVLMSILGVAGLGLYLSAGGLQAPNGTRSTPEIVALVLLVLVALFLHECGHAFTVRRFGKEVNRGGLIMMYGMPGAYIDTSDMWLAPKPARLAVTAAGPFVNFVLGGLASLAMALWPERASFFSFFAFTNYLFIIANAIPFLKFDGYYLLMDWLEIPNLLERATGFFQRELWVLLRRNWAAGEWWPKFTREQWIFVFFGGISSLWMINLLYLPLLVMPARVFGLLGQVLTADLRTVAGVGLLGSLALALFFGLLQANMFSANVRQQVQQLARTVQNRPGWQSAFIILLVALVLGFLPEEMRLQPSLASSANFWAQALPILLPLLAAGFSASLAFSMAGSPWRGWYSGLTVSSIALLIKSQIPITDSPITNSLILFAFLTLSLAFVLSFRLWRFAVRGDLGGVLLLIGLSVALWPVSGDWAWRVALALWCGTAFLAWHLIRRPLLPPARLVDMTQAEDADPAQHTPHLARTFNWLLRTTLQQTVEVSGPASRAKLVETFNGLAVDCGWPLWFNAHGLLTDQVTAPFNERAQIYRSALASWLALLSQETDPRFAADTLAQAYFDLPLRLRRLAASHVLNELPWEGTAPSARSEQGGDRLKLRLAFRHLAEGPMLACARVYGRPLAEQLMGEFNQVAALAEWGLWFRANGRLADEAQGDVLALGEIFQSALADVLGRMAYYTGARFVEASLLQTHDALPWQLREVAAPALLRALPWASRLKLGEAESVVELLQKQPAFSALPVETLAQLAQSAKLTPVPAGRRLHAAGQILRWATLVKTGRVEILTANAGTHRVEAVLSAGALLEIEALTTGQAAQTEARTVTAVELLQLPAEAARRALAEAPSRPEAALLSRIPLFRELAPDELRRLALCLRPRTLPAGEVVVQSGASDRDLYVIGGGELAVMVSEAEVERVVAHLGPGEFFGEMALLRGEPRSATVRALTDAQVWTLSADDYADFMREAPALRAALEQMGSRRHLELRAA